MVVIEEGNSAAFRFDDVALVVRASPDIRSRKSGLARHIDELNRRLGGACLSRKRDTGIPFPKRGGKSIEQRAAEEDER